MSTLADDLAQKEYERLCDEISSIQKENNQLARYAVISAATICTVVIEYRDKIATFQAMVKPLPFIIAILFSFRVFALYKRLELISNYIETNFEKNIIQVTHPRLGWETRLNKNVYQAKPRKSFAQGSIIAFWFLLYVLSFIFIFL